MGEVINPNGIQDVFGLQLALICGPVEGDPYTERQLARAWSVFKEELLQGHGSPASRGSRLWGYWRFELGIDPDATTRLERVLALAERGLLTEEERERVRVQAEGARNPTRTYCVTTPREAAESMDRAREAAEQEAIEIAEALK